MEISLQNFEQYIDETILKRGLKYWKDGRVEEIELIDEGKYEAIVNGTEDYTVHISMENNSVSEYYCSCPYDMGPVCKHVVAVLFELNKEQFDDVKRQKKKNGGKTTAAKQKTKPVRQQVSEILEKLAKEELAQFVSKLCERDKHTRNFFIAQFSMTDEADNSATYAAMIKADIRSAQGRDGFIDYSDADIAVRTAEELLDNAEINFEKETPQQLYAICKAIISEVSKTFSNGVDDSDGSIGGTIENAIELLHKMAIEKNISGELKNEIFEFCVKYATGHNLDYGGWEFDILDIAGTQVQNDKQKKELFSLLDKMSANKDWHYYEEKAAFIKADVIKQTEGNNAAEEFFEKMMHLPDFRKQKIEKLFAAGKYKEVKKIAADSVVLDKEFAGLVNDWKEWLLKTAIAEKDVKAILYYARKLYFESHDKKENYQILKKYTEPGKWTETVESVLEELDNGKTGWNSYEKAEVFIEEKMFDRLFDLIKKDPSYSHLESYEKYLIKDYKDELVDIYENSILNYLRQNTGRSHYEKSCRMLRRMKKLGNIKEVTSLIENLKTQYKQRRALIEELQKV
ncbi:MAG: SWIM zinc finger family protein [Bacteroidales bacterium]